jgi:periplasmic protein CpxP/Spy
MKNLFRSKFVIAALVVLALAAGVAGVFAQGRPGGRGPGGPGAGGPGRGGVDLPLRQLDLTDTQRDQVKDVMQRHREELQRTMEQVRVAMDAQRNAIETVPLDEGLVRSTADTLAAAQAEAAVLRARIHNEVYELLTPAQQTKLKELAAQRETRMKERQQQFQNRRQQRRPTA